MKRTFHAVRAACLSLLVALPAMASEVHPAMLRDWQNTWDRVVWMTIEAYLQKAGQGGYSKLEPKDRRWALDELRAVIEPAISWDVMGDVFVAAMHENCGFGVLEQMLPYYTKELEPSQMDQTVAQQYANCARQATADTVQALEGALAEVASELNAVHARYGVKLD